MVLLLWRCACIYHGGLPDRGAGRITLSRNTGKVEFAEGIQGLEQRCHSEPVRRLVWESPSTFGYLIVIQTVLSHRFPEFVHEKWCFYPGDCHTSDVGHWFAMTGNSSVGISIVQQATLQNMSHSEPVRTLVWESPSSSRLRSPNWEIATPV